MKTLQPEALYTSEEVSEYLHVSLRTVQRLLQAGTLKSYRVHGQYRIKGLDLLGYLDGVRSDPERPEAEDQRPARLLEQLELHPISLQLAPDLVPVVDPAQNPAFLPALDELRRRISQDLGFIMPGVRLCDDTGLAAGHYRICIYNQAVGQGQLEALADSALDRLLAGLEQLIRQFAHEILTREEVAVMVEYL
ncbi:MAG: FHIPEP family type III secretion protein, partial [Candidatus Sericytochromatia bacterium]